MWASATQSHSHCRTLSCLSRSGVPPLSKLASIGFSWGSSRSGKFLKLQGKHNLHRRHSHYTALGRAPTKAHPRPTRGAERSGAALASAPAPSSVVITARVGLMRGRKLFMKKFALQLTELVSILWLVENVAMRTSVMDNVSVQLKRSFSQKRLYLLKNQVSKNDEGTQNSIF